MVERPKIRKPKITKWLTAAVGVRFSNNALPGLVSQHVPTSKGHSCGADIRKGGICPVPLVVAGVGCTVPEAHKGHLGKKKSYLRNLSETEDLNKTT